MATFIKWAALRISALAALSLAATTASAIERTVPGNHATIALALAAASDGDVIRITDSGVYTDQLVINKSVQIIADAGANPVIRRNDDQAGTGAAVIVTTGAQGGRLGSIGGGRITVDRNTDISSTIASREGIFVNGIATGQEYTIENVYITGFTTGAIAVGNLTGYSTTVGNKGTLRINIVEIDGGHTATDYNGAAGQMGLRVLGNAANYTGTFILNRVLTHSLSSHAVKLNHSSTARLDDVTLIVDTCDLNTFYGGAIDIGNAKNVNLSVTNTFMLGGGYQGSWGAFRYSTAAAQGPPGGTLSFSNSVATVWPLAGIQCVLGIPTNSNADNITLNIDHCDLIVRLGGGNTYGVNTPATRNGITVGTGINRTLNITNNNIYGPEQSTTVTLAGIVLPASTASDVVNIHHNNVFVSGEAYVNLTPGAGEVIPGVDPGYVDVTNRDFRVTNPAILSASTTGTPLGTNRIFVNFVPVELSAFGLQ